MLSSLSHRVFFRFELSIRRIPRAPRIDGTLDGWRQEHLLPRLSMIDGVPGFADVYAAWNDDGMYFAFHVQGRNTPLRCDPALWWKGDGVRICIDTRDARDNKRATRFCHFYYAMPAGGGKNRKQPLVGLHKMSRAKEPPPSVDLSLIRIGLHVERDEYALEAGIPASCLNGWNPVEHPRIGFYYKVKDSGLGAQHLCSDEDLGWNADPSTWATAVLAGGA